MKQHNQEIASGVRKLNLPRMMSGELINDFFNVNGYVLMHVKLSLA